MKETKQRHTRGPTGFENKNNRSNKRIEQYTGVFNGIVEKYLRETSCNATASNKTIEKDNCKFKKNHHFAHST